MLIKKVVGTLKINTALMFLSLSYETPGVLRERLVALVAKEPRDRDSLSRFSRKRKREMQILETPCQQVLRSMVIQVFLPVLTSTAIAKGKGI